LDMLPHDQLIRTIVASETDYMTDRMQAIAERHDNPEGIVIARFGGAVCLYSRTMPWGSFNAVKGISDADIDHLDAIIAHYGALDRKPQFEIVPSLVSQELLSKLAERGFYQSGFHASAVIGTEQYRDADPFDPSGPSIRIEAIGEHDFDRYAAIHCRGTGLPDDGIPHVAANNRVLSGRAGWTHYIAYVEDSPAAAGVMYRTGSVASLTFAATLPEYRNRGLQRQLLLRRILDAGTAGSPLVVGQCAFLSGSHRNMERVGMRLAYVRTNWTMKQ